MSTAKQSAGVVNAHRIPHRASLRRHAKQSLVAVAMVGAIGYSTWLTAENLDSAEDETVNDDNTVVIETSMGKVKGISSDELLHFRGIGYAQPPVGDRRFLSPAKRDPWSDTLDATEFPNRCMQPAADFLGETIGELSEDCLYLNVITPSTEGDARPVLVWIHGGGFVNGSANEYNGDMLARDDVVVVTINYRLGLLGYLDLSALGDEFSGSASNGFRDQIMALEWVRDNIADYGGNPQNVTIFGESAGGASVLALLAAPSADGLYHKAIAHSPGIVDSPPPDIVTPLMAQLQTTNEKLIAELRGLPTTRISELQQSLPSISGSVDGTVITRTPEQAIAERGKNGVPLIAGTNRDEGTFFSALFGAFQPNFTPPTAEFAETFMGSDPTEYIAALKALHVDKDDVHVFDRVWIAMFSKAAIGSVVQAATKGAGGWLYQFDLPSTTPFLGKSVGATHAAEIVFTFNRMNSDEPGILNLYDPSDPAVRNLSRDWSATVLAFAKNGDPNGAGLPPWPQYDPQSRPTLVLDAESRIEHDLNRDERLLWEKHWVKTSQ